MAHNYLDTRIEDDLVANLYRQLEVLNNHTFTDAEWIRFFGSDLANQNNGIEKEQH